MAKLDCDSCPSDEAIIEIILSEGQVYNVCEDCIFICIRDNASKENPVFAVSQIEDE